MKPSLIIKEILPFLAMFGSLILATIITDALLHQLELVWIGRWVAIPGTILILLSFFYSIRKRKIISFSTHKALLTLHEVLTWVGFAHDYGIRGYTYLHHPTMARIDRNANQRHKWYDWNISIGSVSPLPS